MSDESMRSGQVQSTPEAAPLAEGEELVPPTWREHMDGPIIGLDDAGSSPPPAASPAAAREEPATQERMPGMGTASGRAGSAEEELRKWPPYSGKPVSEVRWDALRYAAPVVGQAEKLAIKTINLSGRGLSKLARFLETRRQDREEQRGR